MPSAVTALVVASFGLVAYARAHRIDLGAAGAQFETALEAVAPGITRRLDTMCPRSGLIFQKSSTRGKRKLAKKLGRKTRGDAKVNPVKGKLVRSHEPNGVVQVWPAGT